MPRLFRSTAAALALALLVAGGAQAGPLEHPPTGGRQHRGPAAFLDLVKDWIESLSRLSPVWEKEGGIMDPNGRDGIPPPGPRPDAGGIMDPDG